MAVALQEYFHALDIKLWYLIVIVAILPLMAGSIQTYLAKLNGVLFPVFLIGIIGLIVTVVMKSHGASGWWAFKGVLPVVERPVPGILAVFGLYMGLWIMMPVTIDFARMGKESQVRRNQYGTFGIGLYSINFLLSGLVGALAIRAIVPQDPTAETGVVTAVIGAMGVWGLLFILVTQTRINSLNYYLASTNAERVFGTLTKRIRIPRRVWIVVVGAAAYVLMLSNVFSYIQKALAWQGDLLASWGGIVLVYLAASNEARANPEYRKSRLGAISWAFGIWCVAAGVGFVFTEDTTLAPALTAVAPLMAFAVAVVLYGVTYRWSNARVRTSVMQVPGVPETGTDVKAIRVRCDSCDGYFVAGEMDVMDGDGDNARVVCAGCQ